ncbi:beta-lactamase/transpeptidase-like protein [Xylariaceae sp. FL1019]|nr:beta-lactamase/transpeptidase-like protein [Xylariaceae sp. FL1019]
MRLLKGVAWTLSVYMFRVRGELQICPLRGQQFPAPTGLSSEALFMNATKSIEQILTANITQSPYNDTTFSLGMFSTSDDGLLWEFHHTDSTVATSGNGTNKVDADSIYRIASISKILTVYQWLIKDGDRKFNDPISDFIPELVKYQVKHDYYPTPDWDEITVNDLAMFLAGVARDYGLNDVAIESLITNSIEEAAAEELADNPDNGINVPEFDDPVCGYFTSNRTYDPCSELRYLHKVTNLAPSFGPATTPLYSNANFAILGIALSKMLKAPLEDIFDETIVKPLGLTGTSITNPESVTGNSVIPGGDLTQAGWEDALGPLNGAAGAFSTTNDLAAIGKSIMDSTLMSKATTRRWFATTSFVDQISQAVGRGWEIFRVRNGIHTVDLYSKSGSWGVYRSVIFLIPDYNFGFTILAAAGEAYSVTETLPDLIVDTLVPVLEEIARQQTQENFGGRYVSKTTNTSVTVTTDDWPGLKVTEYMAGNVDLIENVFALFGEDVDVRLVPNSLYKSDRKVGFTAVYQPPTEIPAEDEFYWPCQSWLDVDDFTYASVPLGNMMFELGAHGKAKALKLNALNAKLVKVPN